VHLTVQPIELLPGKLKVFLGIEPKDHTGEHQTIVKKNGVLVQGQRRPQKDSIFLFEALNLLDEIGGDRTVSVLENGGDNFVMQHDILGEYTLALLPHMLILPVQARRSQRQAEKEHQHDASDHTVAKVLASQDHLAASSTLIYPFAAKILAPAPESRNSRNRSQSHGAREQLRATADTGTGNTETHD
jgi:hypothetical protein